MIQKIILAVFLLITNLTLNAQNIIEHNNITLDFSTTDLTENNLMFLNVEDMQTYSAQYVSDNPVIGDIGYLHHDYFGVDILASPDAHLIEVLYSANGIYYNPNNKRNTKFIFSEIEWNNITIFDFDEIPVSDMFPNNYGYGVDTILTPKIIKFQTQDNIVGFMQVNISKLTASISVNVKLLNNPSKINNISQNAECYIYPNPAIENISIEGIEKASIQILDMTGKVLLNNTNEKIIDVSYLQKGIYFLKVKDEDEYENITIFKFIKL